MKYEQNWKQTDCPPGQTLGSKVISAIIVMATIRMQGVDGPLLMKGQFLRAASLISMVTITEPKNLLLLFYILVSIDGNQTVLQGLFFQIPRSVKTLLRLMAGWQYNAELTAFCASHFQCVHERRGKGFLLLFFALILVYLNFCFICGGNAACCINIMHYWQCFIARYQARNIFRSISIACQAAMHVKCIFLYPHTDFTCSSVCSSLCLWWNSKC